MFETEIIINAMLYALNQSMNSKIKVLGTDASSRMLYAQIKKLCADWGVSDTMLQECWQFDEYVWEECTHRFNETYFVFSSSIGDIQVVANRNDMVFFFTADTSLEEIEKDTSFEFEGKTYDFYDLTDGIPYYSRFSGFEGKELNETERYALLYKVANCLDKDSSADFIKQLIWSDLLHRRHGCIADDVGNMPCDNGRLCDRCHNDAAMQTAYNALVRAIGLDK